MAVILDTNVFIAAEKASGAGTLDGLLARIPEAHRDDEALISVITASELLMGVHRARRASVRSRRQAFVDTILDQFRTIPIDLRVAREHSRLTATLLSKGKPIGTHDSWIAATALTFSHAIATANTREFSQVKGLEVIEIAH